MTTGSLTNSTSDFTAVFSGQVLRPGDEGYEDARKVHNGLIDKRPALIARCRGTADVVDAVNFARMHGLEVAVRGGGHNVAGRATIDGGLMIDLTPMKGIHVDPKRCLARAEGGATWADLNRETQLHGLAVTGGVVSTTGMFAASLRSFANELRLSQVSTLAASWRSPVKITRSALSAARIVSDPIQIAVIVRRSVEM
jgi:FAD binding domain